MSNKKTYIALAIIKTMPFEFKKTNIPDLIIIEPKVFKDNRGFYLETYKKSEFQKNRIKEEFLQDNFSFSTKKVLRGMHFQKDPHSQGKLIWVAKGEVFDVAVDLRKNSPTFKKWFGIVLSEENKKMFYIPAGFAHGFCVLSEEAQFSYKVTKEYAPESESGFIWDDKDIKIKWPVNNPVVSEKDLKLPEFKDLKIEFSYKQ